MKNKIVTVTLNPCIDKTITVDGFVYGGLNRVKSICTDIGGKGINVSKVLKSFDADVFACGIDAGNTVTTFLNDIFIPNNFVLTEGKVRTNYKIVDGNSGVTTEINEAGVLLSNGVLENCVNKIVDVLSSAEFLILSGSVPLGVGEDIYRRLIELAASFGVKTVLDADGNKLKYGIDAVPYAIKPNLFEFEQLVGKKLNCIEEIVSAAENYIRQGIGMIAVSMGADGAIFVSREGKCISKALPVDCKSTVGAGDSMVAAIAYGLQCGFDLERIVRFASAAGSITASKEGSKVCTAEEVMNFLEKVELSFI